MGVKKLEIPVGIPLDRFIKRKQDEFQYATGELSQILRDLALAGKVVNREVTHSGLGNLEGEFGKTNIQGEDQKKLDVLANIRFKKSLRNGGMVCAVISEEEKDLIENLNPDGKYVIAIDPLDGSSNIDVNVSIGTIFSIYRRKSPIGSKVTEDDFLQKGNEQVAAGYLLYGSSCILVYTTGYGVNSFTYEDAYGEYFLSHKNISTPEEGIYYSINEGSYNYFPESIKSFVDDCKNNEISARYIGSLVADFHRNMLKGGIYLYPPTIKNPKGKLRLCYECNALAFIQEQAGGLAIDGKNRIMNIKPSDIHQRVPFITGSKKLTEKAMSFFN